MHRKSKILILRNKKNADFFQGDRYPAPTPPQEGLKNLAGKFCRGGGGTIKIPSGRGVGWDRFRVSSDLIGSGDLAFSSVRPPVCMLNTQGGRGGGVTSYIYGIVRMCMPNSPLFQHCQVYDWPPFFNKKYMNGPIFLDSCVKGPIFLTSWYMYLFFAQIFRGCFSFWYYMN